MPLTTQQKEWLQDNYVLLTPAEAAEKLGVPVTTVYNAAYRLKISKPKERGRKPVVATVLQGTHKGFNKAQLQNRQVFATRPVNLTGKVPVQIDRRTVVYANPGDKIKDILNKYKPLACK